MDYMTVSSLVFHILVFVDVLLIRLPGYFGYSSCLKSANQIQYLTFFCFFLKYV